MRMYADSALMAWCDAFNSVDVEMLHRGASSCNNSCTFQWVSSYRLPPSTTCRVPILKLSCLAHGCSHAAVFCDRLKLKIKLKKHHAWRMLLSRDSAIVAGVGSCICADIQIYVRCTVFGGWPIGAWCSVVGLSVHGVRWLFYQHLVPRTRTAHSPDDAVHRLRRSCQLRPLKTASM